MYYVYFLKSRKDRRLYTGCTKDLKNRFKVHNLGGVYSTKLRKPLQLIHYEALASRDDAFQREQWLKTGWGRNQVTKMLRNALKI